MKVAGKMFALIPLDSKKKVIALKCDPDRSEHLRMHYESITGAPRDVVARGRGVHQHLDPARTEARQSLLRLHNGLGAGEPGGIHCFFLASFCFFSC